MTKKNSNVPPPDISKKPPAPVGPPSPYRIIDCTFPCEYGRIQIRIDNDGATIDLFPNEGKTTLPHQEKRTYL